MLRAAGRAWGLEATPPQLRGAYGANRAARLVAFIKCECIAWQVARMPGNIHTIYQKIYSRHRQERVACVHVSVSAARVDFLDDARW